MNVIFLLLLLMSSICFAEQIAVLPDGKKIIVFDNGTWKAEESVKPILSVFDSSCSALTEIKTDKVTGKTSTTNKEPIIITKDDKNGIVINIIKFSEGLILSIKAIGAGNCIDEGDKIYVLFSDKSKLELASDGDFNCDSKATIYFGGRFVRTDLIRSVGPSTSHIYLGSLNGLSEFFTGSIDDVMIFNRALTPEEIKKIYDAGRSE